MTQLLTAAGVFDQGILLFRGLFVGPSVRALLRMRPRARAFTSTAAAGSAAAVMQRLGAPLRIGVDDAEQDHRLLPLAGD